MRQKSAGFIPKEPADLEKNADMNTPNSAENSKNIHTWDFIRLKQFLAKYEKCGNLSLYLPQVHILDFGLDC